MTKPAVICSCVCPGREEALGEASPWEPTAITDARHAPTGHNTVPVLTHLVSGSVTAVLKNHGGIPHN